VSQRIVVAIDTRTLRRVRTEGNESEQRWLVTPGSTVKPFVLMALLQAKKLTADEPFFCPRNLTIAGRTLNCSHPALNTPLTIRTAIAYSCNCFVAHFADRFGNGELPAILTRAGFQAGAADHKLQALGEAGVLVSTVDLANAYQRLALNAPDAIREGLEGSVEFGTSRLAALPAVKVAGKTGTGRDHAWFAGFAPSRSPRFVVSVLVAGKSGGADAAPIGGSILNGLL
jgi:cell division protein FtsI/penicillin-binding protein 2